MAKRIFIDGLEEEAYLGLKAEAERSGLGIGDAASRAFRMWTRARRGSTAVDSDRVRRASRRIEIKRGKLKYIESRDSTRVIRAWRDARGG